MEYDALIAMTERVLDTAKFGVLATANADGVVSASQMCVVNDGLTVYVQTDKSFEKVQNIKENSRVALNLGAFYFKGTAEILGHPLDYPDFIAKLKKKHFETYEHYSRLPNEVLIRIELTECKIWGIDNSKSVHEQESIQIVNFRDKTVSLFVCDKM